MQTKINLKKTASIIAIAGFTFFALASGDSDNGGSSTTSDAETVNTEQTVGIGEPLKTDYFEITVNKVDVKDRVSTGNEFADLKPEKGNKYLIIDATFKNIDNESRMIMEGSVWINYNGQKYEFDSPEQVMLEGWGTMLDQINPLTTKTTKLVYKLPSEITGTAFWQPGRSDDDELINLGEIK